ncbi:hypothetical protein L227DRAFT_70264 [Lentinus tigrinus ALCF2SS1-6]|uniref:Uncharacterized protein n=1 Tax=Lentinus tigrinus ALCF2SS1-6 TaxID=1328759 RepID=A0A5C2SE07_9APHY|nr:hypothetical protein L227DRAFT_70264 [Lentinus tigrinus ALCF2SS1-6]
MWRRLMASRGLEAIMRSVSRGSLPREAGNPCLRVLFALASRPRARVRGHGWTVRRGMWLLSCLKPAGEARKHATSAAAGPETPMTPEASSATFLQNSLLFCSWTRSAPARTSCAS